MTDHHSVPYLLGTGFHRLAFREFGAPKSPAVVCVHGLTRNGHDFDVLAEFLADRFHVICPDLPGRGASGWLPQGVLYQPATYVIALAHLLAYLNKPVAWIGTSLGGICGMMVAAAGHTPVTRLILNDIGPLIPAAALGRIRDYMTEAPVSFQSLDALEAHLRVIHAPFGPLSDVQWADLARHSARSSPNGDYVLHYDPKIVEPIRDNAPQDVDLGAVWRLIRVPVLAIRGAHSDLLTEATFAQMQAGGAATLTVPDAGHAPALMDLLAMSAIRQFLEQS